jgi:hypothetical protein
VGEGVGVKVIVGVNVGVAVGVNVAIAVLDGMGVLVGRRGVSVEAGWTAIGSGHGAAQPARRITAINAASTHKQYLRIIPSLILRPNAPYFQEPVTAVFGAK